MHGRKNIKLLQVVYKQIVVQIGRFVSKSKFDISEGQNTRPRNKRIFYTMTLLVLLVSYIIEF